MHCFVIPVATSPVLKAVIVLGDGDSILGADGAGTLTWMDSGHNATADIVLV